MVTAFLLNTFVALALGVVIGVERQWRHHFAGLKTNALVSLGAAMFVGLSAMSDRESSPTRVAAQVVSGLGFLGGGVILRDGMNVHGLNTAATIWCSGAVGSLAGAGFLWQAALGAVLVLLGHVSLQPASRWIDARSRPSLGVDSLYRIRLETDPSREAEIRTLAIERFSGHGGLVLQGIASAISPSGSTVVTADLFAHERADQAVEVLVAALGADPKIIAVSWQRTSV